MTARVLVANILDPTKPELGARRLINARRGIESARLARDPDAPRHIVDRDDKVLLEAVSNGLAITFELPKDLGDEDRDGKSIQAIGFILEHGSAHILEIAGTEVHPDIWGFGLQVRMLISASLHALDGNFDALKANQPPTIIGITDAGNARSRENAKAAFMVETPMTGAVANYYGIDPSAYAALGKVLFVLDYGRINQILDAMRNWVQSGCVMQSTQGQQIKVLLGDGLKKFHDPKYYQTWP